MDRATGELTVTLNADGSVSTNATKLEGTEAEIMVELEAITSALGGKLTVEKHVHTHGHSHVHSNADHVHLGGFTFKK